MDVEARLRDFITDTLGWSGPRSELTPDYPLIDNEVLDSLGIFQVVTFLEESFGVSIDDEELVPDNFETLGTIAQLIDAKLQYS